MVRIGFVYTPGKASSFRTKAVGGDGLAPQTPVDRGLCLREATPTHTRGSSSDPATLFELEVAVIRPFDHQSHRDCGLRDGRPRATGHLRCIDSCTSEALIRGVQRELDAATVDAVKRFEFNPGTLMGEPVRTVVTFEMRFSAR